MHEDELKPEVTILPVDEGSQVNLDTARDFGLAFQDFPEIRESIRKYALITVAAQMVLDEKGRQGRIHGNPTVLMVRDTKELLVDGRPALDVVYSTSVAMPLQNGSATYTEHTQVPIETVKGIITRLENGDIPFKADKKHSLFFEKTDIQH